MLTAHAPRSRAEPGPLMADPWISLALLNASILALTPLFVCVGWASMVFGSVAGPQPRADLLALGLDRMPSSWDALRKAYRAAARATHPDAAGGSKEAFQAVVGAFERLKRQLDLGPT
jgi:hypothetical protein